MQPLFDSNVEGSPSPAQVTLWGPARRMQWEKEFRVSSGPVSGNAFQSIQN
jgi:hypothetical protein